MLDRLTLQAVQMPNDEVGCRAVSQTCHRRRHFLHGPQRESQPGTSPRFGEMTAFSWFPAHPIQSPDLDADSPVINFLPQTFPQFHLKMTLGRASSHRWTQHLTQDWVGGAVGCHSVTR